jgi:protein-disulfide isomerase
MLRARILSLTLIAAVVALPSACANSGGGRPSAARKRDRTPVVAVIERGVIREQELDERLKEDWFAAQSANPTALYKLRLEVLDRIIDERVLAAEARRESLSESQVMDMRIQAKGPVTDEEIETFYEQNQDRIRSDQTLEELNPRIREFLSEDRRNQVIADLRREAGAKIVLEPPRFEIADVGPSRGPADARITIQEFSDYECPYCKRAEANLDEVLALYPDDVRLVYRQFPLDFHPQARGASKAAICADSLGRFWEYHDLLFDHQKNLGMEALIGYAEELGLDRSEFETCLEADSTRIRVDEDIAAARATGATATPTFFINGIQLRGAKPVGAFQAIIDREIAKLNAEEAAAAEESEPEKD